MLDVLLVRRSTSEYNPGDRVYFLLRDGEVVYVGRSAVLDSRIQAHRNSDKQFDEVRFVDADPGDASLLERALILFLAPEYNVIHSGGRLSRHDLELLHRYGFVHEWQEVADSIPIVEDGKNPQIEWMLHRVSLALSGQVPSRLDFNRFCAQQLD